MNDPHNSSRKDPVAGIVLAAGRSRRMGTTKQLLELGGKPLLAWVVEAALASELARVIVVLGHEAGSVEAALGSLVRDPRLSLVLNAGYREGMAGSLQAGLGEVKDDFAAVMFLLGDQPLVTAGIIDLLLRRFRESQKDICVPIQGERRGNPVIFGRRFYDLILGVRGDRGAREIIGTHPGDVLGVEIDGPPFFLDIDSAADVEQVRALLRATSTPKPPAPFP